jgi:hypothetical protein
VLGYRANLRTRSLRHTITVPGPGTLTRCLANRLVFCFSLPRQKLLEGRWSGCQLARRSLDEPLVRRPWSEPSAFIT